MATIIAWAGISIAAKVAADQYTSHNQNPINALLYQPLGFAISGGLYGLLNTNFRPDFDLIGALAGGGAGFLLGFGLIFLVKALSLKEISSVSPVTAMYPLITILIAVIFTSDIPDTVQTAGAVLAVIAVAAMNGGVSTFRLSNLRESWFGFAFTRMALSGVYAFLPSLALVYLNWSSAIVYQAIGYLLGGSVIAIILLKGKLSWDSKAATFSLLSGVCSGVGGIFYFQALQHGSVALVAPLTSLYPLVAILSGILFFRERIAPVQQRAIALSMVGLMMMNFG